MKTNATGSRLTICQARKGLGLIGRNYSDQQIEDILALMRSLAEMTYEELSFPTGTLNSNVPKDS